MVHEAVTPNGTSIVFEDGAKDEATGKGKKRRYLVNGQEMVSVTTALRILDKPALMYWAEKLAVQGAITLAADGELPQSVDGALARMKSENLRFFQVRDSKADRGNVTHEELVRLATGQELVDIDTFPPEQRGFIQGASAWFADHRPRIVEQEQMVASLEHGFAGRPDAFGEIPVLGDGKFLIDYKSLEKFSYYKDGVIKAPYAENLLQVGAYELARRECEYEPADRLAIVRISGKGEHHTFVTEFDPEPFLAVLRAYLAVRGVTSGKLSKKALAA